MIRATYNLNERKSSRCTTLSKIRVWSTLIASFPLSTLSYKENLILVILIKKTSLSQPRKNALNKNSHRILITSTSLLILCRRNTRTRSMSWTRSTPCITSRRSRWRTSNILQFEGISNFWYLAKPENYG